MLFRQHKKRCHSISICCFSVYDYTQPEYYSNMKYSYKTLSLNRSGWMRKKYDLLIIPVNMINETPLSQCEYFREFPTHSTPKHTHIHILILNNQIKLVRTNVSEYIGFNFQTDVFSLFTFIIIYSMRFSQYIELRRLNI